ncbi:MAG: hypothetical protein ABL957_06890 [Parvularculaceae bacterium]
MRAVIRAAALALGTVFAASSASAQQTIANPAGMVKNFDVANLGAVLTDLGVAFQAQTRPDGARHILITINGLNVNLIPTACVGANGSGCLGLHTLALFEGTANSQSLAAFDQKYVFTSVGALSNEAVMYLSRYDIADFGIPRGNVQSSLGNFLYIAEQFSAEVGASSQTVSLEGFADDMSASALNAAGARKLGVSMAAGDIAALHRAEIAATPELVRTLSKIGGARLNKIANGRK